MAEQGGHLRPRQRGVGSQHESSRGGNQRGGERGAAFDRIVAVPPGRKKADPGSGDIRCVAVLGESERVPTVGRVDDSPVRARRHRKNTGVGSRVEGFARRALRGLGVAGRRHHHDAVGDRVLDRLLLVNVRPTPCGVLGTGEAREGHVDHLGPGAHRFVNAGRLVRRVAVPSVVEHLEIDHLGVPSQPGNAEAVVRGRGDQPSHHGAVPVLVVRRGAKWPVVLADVLAHHNLSDELGMLGVNAGV